MKTQHGLQNLYTLAFLTISTLLFSWPGYRNGSDRSGFVSGDKTNSAKLSKMWECQVSSDGGGVGLPVIYGGFVYAAADDGRVVKVGLKGGDVVGSFSLRGGKFWGRFWGMILRYILLSAMRIFIV